MWQIWLINHEAILGLSIRALKRKCQWLLQLYGWLSGDKMPLAAILEVITSWQQHAGVSVMKAETDMTIDMFTVLADVPLAAVHLTHGTWTWHFNLVLLKHFSSAGVETWNLIPWHFNGRSWLAAVTDEGYTFWCSSVNQSSRGYIAL